MKYYVQRNENARFGLECVAVDENGVEKVFALNKKTTDNYLFLPDECVIATNRKLVGIKIVKEANVDRYEITQRERLATTSTKKLEDYMNDEDKATYLAIIERAKKAKEEASKPMTELEKAQRAYDKALAKLEALKQQG